MFSFAITVVGKVQQLAVATRHAGDHFIYHALWRMIAEWSSPTLSVHTVMTIMTLKSRKMFINRPIYAQFVTMKWVNTRGNSIRIFFHPLTFIVLKLFTSLLFGIFLSIGEYNLIRSIPLPCCNKDSWCHKLCLQQYAQTSGYFLKCPLCKDSDIFRDWIAQRGVFIPDR